LLPVPQTKTPFAPPAPQIEDFPMDGIAYTPEWAALQQHVAEIEKT
jgi:hypothetical protein